MLARLAAVALLTASSAYAAKPQKVAAVADAKIDFNRKTAIVAFDPDQVSTAALIKATTDAAYPSKLHITP